MSLLVKFDSDVLGWQRKQGPPKVWAVVDGRKAAANGEIPKFSIQEIPEDRYEDALSLMSSVLPQDEPICISVGIINDPQAIKDFHKLWSFCLQQGCVVGAFLIEPNNPKPVLVGLNMTWIICAASREGMSRNVKIISPGLLKVATFMSSLEEEVNVHAFYKVDKYMSAYGLAIDRAFRGQGIANHILKARDMMCKAYDVPATATVFSGPVAQKAAANVGLEVLIERNYSDVQDEEGNELFPGISVNVCKLMGKRFS